MKFSTGDYVGILRGEYQGMTGVVSERNIVNKFLNKYKVNLTDSIYSVDIIEEDLQLLNIKDGMPIHRFLMTDEIDIGKYLTDDQLKQIAEDIYSKMITKKVDEVLDNRSFGGSITDVILNKVVDRYSEKLGDKFEEEFLKRIKEVLYLDEHKKGEWDETFLESLRHRLRSAVDAYITDNTDEINSHIKPMLHIYVEKLMDKNVSKGICDHLNRIIADALQQTMKEVYDEGICKAKMDNTI